MSILRQLKEFRSGTPQSLSAASIPPPTWYMPTDSGQNVNTDTAMRLVSVWACVNLLTDIVAPLEWHAYRVNPDGSETRVPDPRLLVHPSNERSLTAADWRGQVMRSLLLRGNAYGLVKETGAYGELTMIQIIHPDYVSVVRLGPLGPFEFRVLGERHDLYPLGDLWHLPAFTTPGSPVGLSPIDYARQQIGLGLATEEFGAKWFGDQAIPSGLLHTDQALTSEQAADMKQRWQEAHADNRSIAVLGAGLEFSQVSVSPNESQFLDTMKFNAQQIAMMFGIPPEMVGQASGNSMTYSNVESRFLNLLTLSGRPWIVKLEHALSELLRTKNIVRAQTADLLRTDPKTRVMIQQAEMAMGKKSADEVRHEDGLPPLPDGKGTEYNWPPNSVRLMEPGQTPSANPPDPSEAPTDAP